MIPPTEAQMLDIYRTMLKIRLFEEEILRREEKGLAIHSCAGHEAVAVGILSQLTDKDLIVSNHRPWGHFLAKGGTLMESFAELYGKPSGVSHGLGGEMGICKPEIGFVQSTMIVGASWTLGCGVALSLKYQKSPNIALAFGGESSSTNGAFNEAMTLAKVFNLPILFIVENNFLSGNTPSSEFMPSELVTHRAMGYGFPTMVCDGSDVLAVWEAGQKAIEYVKTQRGPYLLECLVSRINRHKVPRMPDVRSPEEKRMARMRDPLPKLRNALIRENLLDFETDTAIEDKIKEEIAQAIKNATS